MNLRRKIVADYEGCRNPGFIVRDVIERVELENKIKMIVEGQSSTR